MVGGPGDQKYDHITHLAEVRRLLPEHTVWDPPEADSPFGNKGYATLRATREVTFALFHGPAGNLVGLVEEETTPNE